MSKQMKIGLAAAAVAILLLAAWYLKTSDTSTPEQQNTVKNVETVLADKTFKTKTAAYDALANEKETFYNRPASAFKAQPTAATVVVASEPAVTTKTDPVPTKEFDKAYEEVENNMRTMYGETPHAKIKPVENTVIAVQDIIPETEEERRRKAMRQDWGMNGGGTTVDSDKQSGTIRAVIHGTQMVKVGQPALFRTKEPIHHGTLIVPANTLLSGVAGVSTNRLTIKISAVRINNEIYPLPVEVYGSDGMPGIPLNYDEAGQIADNQASQTILQEVSSVASQYGGTLGRIAGSLGSGVGSQVRSAKSIEVKLIDNQSVILKIIMK